MQFGKHSFAAGHWGFVLAGVAVGGLLSTSVVLADEVQISSSNMEDIEFDHDDNLLQWVDALNRLWVAKVDPTTGNFVPSSGMGTLVDTDAATSSTFGNGPEWVQSANGYSLIYTKYQPGTAGNKSASTAFIARADLTPQGWSLATLPNTLGFVEPGGNINPTQADPPVVFHDGTATGANATQLFVQGIYDSNPIPVPNSLNTSGSARFVTGLNELLFSTPVTNGAGRGWRQIFSYDVASGQTTQLTTEAGNKGEVFMWQAPEYDGAWVMMSKVNGYLLRFYTLQFNTKTQKYQWTPVNTLDVPTGAPKYVWSPEPFVYNGKSYVSMVRNASAKSISLRMPTQIWVSSMDGSYSAQVSDPTVTNVVRSDPESFETANGAYIYYLRYSVGTVTSPSRPQGVWRSNAGIPLP